MVVRNVRLFHGRFRRGKREAINDFSTQKGIVISQPGAGPSYQPIDAMEFF